MWIPEWALWVVAAVLGAPCAFFALVVLVASLRYDPTATGSPTPADPRPPEPSKTPGAREG